jgi:hypothetical protein
MRTYRTVRYWRDHPGERETLATGLSEEDALDYCLDPETSSQTATDPDLSRGPWFDGYERE